MSTSVIRAGDSTMGAVRYDCYGPPELLRFWAVLIPEMRPGMVLVRVAASVNAADVAVRSGKVRLFGGREGPPWRQGRLQRRRG